MQADKDTHILVDKRKHIFHSYMQTHIWRKLLLQFQENIWEILT